MESTCFYPSLSSSTGKIGGSRNIKCAIFVRQLGAPKHQQLWHSAFQVWDFRATYLLS